MADLLNPSPPPGEHPARPADADPGIPGSADARMRARARQDKAIPASPAGATPAVPEPPGIDWVSSAGGALVGALCAALTWSGGYEFAQQCDWPAALAWILPLITDIYAGVALWIMLGLRWASKETRHFAAGSTVLAVAASVAMQIMYHILLNEPDHKPAVGVVVAVSVVAPIMLALTAHLMARVNGDRGELVRAVQQAQARHAETQRAEAAQHAEMQRAAADRIAADRAATERAEAEQAAAAQREAAELAAARRAEAERAAAAARAQRTAGDGPPMGHPGDVAHGPDTAGGPSVDHEPPAVDHGPPPADGPDDGDDPDVPWTLPPGEPDEQGDPGDIYVQARNAYRQSCRDNKPLSPRAIAAMFPGKSRNWGKTRITEVQKGIHGIHLARAAGE
jgi:hypothetical protein